MTIYVILIPNFCRFVSWTHKCSKTKPGCVNTDCMSLLFHRNQTHVSQKFWNCQEIPYNQIYISPLILINTVKTIQWPLAHRLLRDTYYKYKLIVYSLFVSLKNYYLCYAIGPISVLIWFTIFNSYNMPSFNQHHF